MSSMPRSPIVPPLSTSEEEVEVVEAGLLSGGYLSREDVEFFIGTTGFIEETDKGKGNGKKKIKHYQLIFINDGIEICIPQCERSERCWKEGCFVFFLVIHGL